MPRAMWTGSISFGLVSVPVRLFPAVRSHDVRFHNLHRPTLARVRQRRVDATTGEEVSYDDIVKGYDLGDGRHVVIDTDELDALAPQASRQIEILDFVDATEIDPLFYARPYYLAPATEAAGKPYRLLFEAMHAADKVAIARFVMRSKEYLAALRALQDGGTGVLVANTMHYHDEVADPAELDGLAWADAEVNDRERAMAQQLIASLETDFEPERYEDQHRQRVQELLETKAEGREVEVPAAEPETGQVVDLMAALEASLGAATAQQDASASGSGPPDRPESAYRDRSKAELYELAQEREIPGRSQMSKDELVAALEAADAAA